MTVVLELPPGMEAQVVAETTRKGSPLSDYLVAIFRERHGLAPSGLETYLLSESALGKDWLRPEEDEAWQHL